MVRAILVCNLLLQIVSVFAQTRLDSLYAIVRHDSRGENIAQDGDEVIVVGAARDTSTFITGIAFSRFSLDGELRHAEYLFNDTSHFVTCNELIIQDSLVYVLPLMGWAPWYLFGYHRYSGELLKKIEIPSANPNYVIVAPRTLQRIDDHRFIFASIVYEENRHNETQITIYDMRDGSMSHMLNRYPGRHQNIEHISWRNDSIWLVGDLWVSLPYEPDYDVRTTIVVLDTMGNELSRYISSDFQAYTSDCIIEKNSDVVVPHSFGKLYDTGIGLWMPQYRPGVSKVNAEGEVIWQLPFGLDHYCDDGFYNFTRAILPSTDGEGFILIGSQSNFSTEQYWTIPLVDTVESGANLQDDAIVTKVSNDGQIIWERSYSKVGQIYSSDELNDMIYHPDGGYLLSGTVAEYIPGKPLVQTWLLYVDEYGCAVPGCQTVSTDEPQDDNLKFLIYPNPVSQNLYVYQGHSETYKYVILDMSGKVIDYFSGSRAGHTFIIDVSDFLPGAYIISRQDIHGRIVSEQWVKQ